MKLTKKSIEGVKRLKDRFGAVAAANVALVLAGFRPAYRFDEQPKWFVKTGDWKDEVYRGRVYRAFEKHYAEFVTFMRANFKNVLDIVDQSEPLVYRVGAVSSSDLMHVSKKSDMSKAALAAYARALNFTGTAFPCNKRKDTVVVSWLFEDGKGKLDTLSVHCAKPDEVYKCIREFAAMKTRAQGLIGVDLGGFIIADLKMSLNRERDVLIA